MSAPSLGQVLAIDTALRRAVVAVGRLDGSLIAEDGWEAGHRHGEELLPRVDRLLRENSIPLRAIGGVIVGTGPGAFTGLRVGIATAKALAHGLGIPLVGVSTAAALLAAADAETDTDASTAALLLPAGPSDRVLVAGGQARLLPAGTDPDANLAAHLIAADLADRAPADAVARGQEAVNGLGASMLRLGAARLAAGDVDDVARVVPEYVTLPRGVTRETGEVAWSRDHR